MVWRGLGAFGAVPVAKHAKGGVIASPIAFPLGGQRVGLAGEAGPEAILPLTRGRDGRLGVRAESAPQALNITFNVTAQDAQSFRRPEGQIAAMLSRAVGRGNRNLQAMAFHEVRFPAGISLGASGGPERRTEIVVLGSGAEERNSRWADSKRSYNAGYGIKSVDDLHAVIAFFEERRGRLHGFRWKDWSDYKSCAPAATPQALDSADRNRQRRYCGVQTRQDLRLVLRPLGAEYHAASGRDGVGLGWRRRAGC